MKRWIVLGGMLAVTMSAGAQISFQEHVTLAKAGTMGPRESAFANACGVDPATATIVNGRAVEETFQWVVVPAVADGTDGQTDNYGSAQVFYLDGKPRLLNVWFAILDVGSYTNEFLCLDASGNPTLQETLNTNEPQGDAKNTWRHLEKATLAANGTPTVTFNKFVTKTGAPVAVAPRLDKDSMAMATNVTPPDNGKKTISELPLKGN